MEKKPVVPTKQLLPDIQPRAGRPTKKALRDTRKVGRPKNDTGRIAEFKERLLATSGEFVINKIIEIALNDNHNGQMAALKMCIDRVLPLSLFEKNGNNKPMVQINIVNATDPNNEKDVIIDGVTINGESYDNASSNFEDDFEDIEVKDD